MYRGKKDEETSYIWIDGEAGIRGGTVYLRLLNDWLIRKGYESSYIRTGVGFQYVLKRAKLVAASWCGGAIIGGTIPRELPFLLLCKKRKCLVHSPIGEWSRISRIGLWFMVSLDSKCLVCVSETTRDSLLSSLKNSKSRVEYAKIGLKKAKEQRFSEREGIVCIVMDNAIVDKGYIWHMAIVSELMSRHRVRVEVYGGGNQWVGDRSMNITYNGYIENPFRHAAERNQASYLFYLGCSRYEGLHMAVVEAGQHYIPSILSDIPAHRELQVIGGSDLLIGKDVKESVSDLESKLTSGEYTRVAEKARCLYERFVSNADSTTWEAE